MLSVTKRNRLVSVAGTLGLIGGVVVTTVTGFPPVAHAAPSGSVRGADPDQTYTTAHGPHSVVLHWAEADNGDGDDNTIDATSWSVTLKAGTTPPKATAKPVAKTPQTKTRVESVTITGLKSGKPYTASIIGHGSGAKDSGGTPITFSTRVAAGAHSLTIKAGKTHDSMLPATAKRNPDLAIVTGPGGHRYAAYATFTKVLFSSASADGKWSKPVVLARGKYDEPPVRIAQSGGNVAVAWSNFSAPLYRLRKAGSTTWSKPVDLRQRRVGSAGVQAFKIDANGKIHAIISTEGRVFYRTNATGTWTTEHLPGLDNNHAYQYIARLVVDPVTQRIVVAAAVEPRDLGTSGHPVLVVEVADAASTSATIGPWQVAQQVPLSTDNMSCLPAVASRGGAIAIAIGCIPYSGNPRSVNPLPPVHGVYLLTGTSIANVGHWSRVPGTTSDLYAPVVSMSSTTTAQLMYGRHNLQWKAGQQGIFWRTITIGADGSWTAGAAHHPTSSAYAIPASITQDQKGHTFVSYVLRAKGNESIEVPG